MSAGHQQAPAPFIPDVLAQLPQWIGWIAAQGEDKRYRLPNGALTPGPLKKGDKPYKLPINPHTGGLADVKEQSTWGTLRQATAAVKRFGLTAIGFVFTESDPFAGVDLDNCRNPATGEIKPWATDIIQSLNSYTEISPFSHGVKITLIGQLPKNEGNQTKYEDGKVEMFSQRRYFAWTGLPLDGTPLTIENRQEELTALHSRLFANRNGHSRNDHNGVHAAAAPFGSSDSLADDELLQRARSAQNGWKFRRLFDDGQWKGDYPSQSEADLALCLILAFWADKDAARIDSLFRRSALMRDKWERQDYREETIQKAITQTRETYRPSVNKRVVPASRNPAAAVKQSAGETPDLLSNYDPEDVGNGQRLIAMYGPGLRFCHAFNEWLLWKDGRWIIDEGERAQILTHKTMKEFALQAVKANNEALTKFAAGCRRSARITNAMREARPYLAIQTDELDADADLVNFRNGTVDLRTGRIRQHRREDFITKLVHYDYQVNAKCPTFIAFLGRITDKHPGLISYLQKAFGYSLTGHTNAKAVFLLYGRGNNGKSTLLTTFLQILKEYAVLLQIDTLMVRQESNNTQADLADLRGARFVMTSETEEGQRLAEGKLKRITQGMGRIKAARKYENPFEFDESHKLWIDANHLPIIRGTDDAIWNRLHPIPFDTTIPVEEQDKNLQSKLMMEAEGILAWAVAGAVRWYSEGLGKPPDVEQASKAWRTDSDQIGRFIEECCIVGGPARARGRQLYQAYRKWTEEAGESAIRENDFPTVSSKEISPGSIRKRALSTLESAFVPSRKTADG